MEPATVMDRPAALRNAGSGEPFAAEIRRKIRRASKFARRFALNAVGQGRDTEVVFIMGAQRSGTRVPLVALEASPDILTYREGARPFFVRGRLADESTLEGLFERCRFPVLVLKPLCDAHRARQLLQRFPRSRVLWIFRWYQDTINSSSLKWSSGVEAVEQLVHDRLRADDWRRGGLTPELLEVARQLYEPGLSLHHANAILWYLRSRLLLDLDLFNCQQTLVIKYEDLSMKPAEHFPRVFAFIGQPFKATYLEKIHGNSVRRSPFPVIPKAVADACEGLYAEIDRRYQQALGKGA
jgi:hypothetical protein